MNDSVNALTCEAARREIVAWIDGELIPEKAEAVQAHIAECGNCASFHNEAVAVLQIARDAFPATETGDLPAEFADFQDAPDSPSEADLLRAELRLMRTEMQTMRAEMAEMRNLLAGMRGRMDMVPPRPIVRPTFPHTAPAMDRLRSDR